MVMDTLQVRLGHEMVKRIDETIKAGLYENRADFIRDAVRRFLWLRELDKMVGSIPNTGDSVKEIRKIRKKLSSEIKSFEDVEKLNKLYR
jgi:Arc/MetJ-type ribon-helix-helix transcriptional regulator